MVPLTKKISSSAILALKDALTNIYWRKDDLKNFIYHAIKNKAIVATIEWNSPTIPKFQNVSILVDRMMARLDIYEEDILLLFKEVCNIADFSHLKKWEDSDLKIKKAKDSVEALRKYSKGYFEILEEKEKEKERKERISQHVTETESFQKRMEILKQSFQEIAMSGKPQERGFQLEKFLNELFLFFDLDPKTSFKITGEQIDGAFTFENSDYLLEAKWQKKLVDSSELYVFASKLSGKLKNTLGLFISIDGFSKDCNNVKAPDIRSMILMDGADLNAVLEGMIDLKDLLYRKRRHASETGNIYLSISKILGG